MSTTINDPLAVGSRVWHVHAHALGTVSSSSTDRAVKVAWDGVFRTRFENVDKHDLAPVNKHDQAVLGGTGKRSPNHPTATVYSMRCTTCGASYGANSCDVWERKCPTCGDGEAGFPLD